MSASPSPTPESPEEQPVDSTAAPPAQIGERYEVLDELGRGGLAIVYRAHDPVTARDVAIKQLSVPTSNRSFREHAAAFEREYQTLVQLSHPRIIEVYDFGVDSRGRYYSMELLDGGELRDQAPLPWPQACKLMYDVCSSLALLHSRRLVHRDISPRNIHSTSNGSAKLIDFGALSPMGPITHIVGTPPFVAPEVLHRSALDGRTDLFSLGATLYFVLTGQLAYPARNLGSLREVWQARPPRPSSIVEDIPPTLDALVLSLISLDPAARPRSAFEVMERLSSIADLERVEESQVSEAYLSTPMAVGLDRPQAALRGQLDEALAGRGKSVLIRGVAGAGRSRLLDECALETKVLGVAVLRVNAATSQNDEPLAVGRALARQVLETMPELALGSAQQEQVEQVLFADGNGDAAGAESVARALAPAEARDTTEFHGALTRWLLRVALQQPLAILVDDLHRVDAGSLALLATLSLSAPRLRLLLVSTAVRDAQTADAQAFSVLARESTAIDLEPLGEDGTEALVASVFGDVPNAALVAERLHGAAQGNPREIMDLARQLVASDVIRYRDGHWVLPAKLAPSDLPSGAADACRQGVARLSPLARVLAQSHALASHPTLGRNDYADVAPEASASQLDSAITELLAESVIATDGQVYSLARREWGEALGAALDEADRRDRHRRLAGLYEQRQQLEVERVDQLLAAGAEEVGLELLTRLLQSVSGDSKGLMTLTRMPVGRLATILDRALTSGEGLQLSPRRLHEIRRALLAVSVSTDESYYLRAAPAWFAQVEQDSGLALYTSMIDVPEPAERLKRALTQAAERYAATPEDDRISPPDKAIRDLAYYVAVSIANGSRMQDAALLSSLPGVLEPFAGLSPTLHAIWQNSIATHEGTCLNRLDSARERWLGVLDALSEVSSTDLTYVSALRNAVIYGVGLLEARQGMTSAEETAARLDDDPMQAVSAMSLRTIARLHQGDFAGAERFRKRGEQLALRGNVRSMFASTVQAELTAFALASDLTGIAQAGRTLESLAARHPSWLAYKLLADGYFEQTRGQFASALAAFERGLAVSAPVSRTVGISASAWPRLQGAMIEVLVSLERAEEAKAQGERALSECQAHGIDAAAFIIRRALALAEAKLGDYEGACRRLAGVIEGLKAAQVTGLELGATYEARARIAIWFSDEDAVETFGEHTAREYRYGEGSSLGARYERLMDEARSSVGSSLPQLVDFRTKMTTTSQTRWVSAAAMVEEQLGDAPDAQERASRALRLLCDSRGAGYGYLYLWTEEGVRCVASLGGDAAQDSARQEMVSRVIDEMERAHVLTDFTVTATATAAVEGFMGTTSWTDSEGRALQALPLVGEIDGRARCIGVAVIDTAAQTSGSVRAALVAEQLTGALGQFMVGAGDARAPDAP